MEKNIKIYWLVIIVIIILSVFIFIQTCNSNNDLVKYFSFAGSITSLVLGLIAIFYSVISNQSSTENFGRLKEAVTKIEEGARIISSVSENINTKLDRISDDIVKFGTKDNENQTSPKSNLTSENPIGNDPDANKPDDNNDGNSEKRR